jgi:uncharacterized protein DUF1326
MNALRKSSYFMLASIVFALGLAVVTRGQGPVEETNWYIKAHLDEACSCPLFCPCYFNTHPAADFCNFNIVYTVQQGNYGAVKLDGMHVWLSGNLGGDFSMGKTEGLVVAFEPTATPQQIDGFLKVAGKIYPVTWQKVDTSDRTAMTFTHTPERHAVSRADGKGAIELIAPTASENDGKAVPVIQNLKYFGAPKNTGFRLYYGTHRYSGHGYNYDYKQHNGFTIDIEGGTPPKQG